MYRLLTVSALFALAILTASAIGQPPGSSGPKAEDKKTEKKADSTDAAIAAALANDADVRIAQAKLQLAEAELAKAKQAVVVKVMNLTAAIRVQQSDVEQQRERAAWADRMAKLAYMTPAQAQAERDKLANAQITLAKLEADLKVLTGGAAGTPGGAPNPAHAQTLAEAMKWLAAHNRPTDPNTAASLLEYLAADLLRERQTLKGPIPDRIRA